MLEVTKTSDLIYSNIETLAELRVLNFIIATFNEEKYKCGEAQALDLNLYKTTYRITRTVALEQLKLGVQLLEMVGANTINIIYMPENSAEIHIDWVDSFYEQVFITPDHRIKYPISNSTWFKRLVTHKFYEVCLLYSGMGTISVNLYWLKDKLRIDGYEELNTFRHMFLNKAIDSINTFTTTNIKHEYIKTGRFKNKMLLTVN